MDEEVRLSLLNIKSGAAIEMFDRQLQRVFNNISDVNTSLKTREILLKIKLTPSKDRSLLSISIDCPPAKLCGQEVEETLADLRMDEHGRYFGRERVPLQRPIEFGNVHTLEGGKKNND